MKLKDRAAMLNHDAVLSILVRYRSTGTEVRHRYRDWSYCAYMDSLVIGEYEDRSFPGETVFIVVANARLERSEVDGTLFYYDEDGELYEIGSLYTPTTPEGKKSMYDMAVILHPVVDVDDSGREWDNYELVDYFHGIECFPDDEIMDACREYIQFWKVRKEKGERHDSYKKT